ncbi:MAG: hypothetical protein QOI06_103 [Nocardioidaceae bacterium]|jgi:predicted transcriptional regulator|nr:hypothetical protein [Nocardioidaceae bacterium]
MTTGGWRGMEDYALADVLQEMRRRTGLTMRQLADIAGVCELDVVLVESTPGPIPPPGTHEMYQRIADALGERLLRR